MELWMLDHCSKLVGGNAGMACQWPWCHSIVVSLWARKEERETIMVLTIYKRRLCSAEERETRLMMMAIADGGRKGRRRRKLQGWCLSMLATQSFPFFFFIWFCWICSLNTRRALKAAQSILKSLPRVPLDHTKYFCSEADYIVKICVISLRERNFKR